MTNVVSGNTIAEIGALVGDAARANILLALMDGRALTAGELAFHAGVTAQTTSGHLAKLLEGRLVAVEQQGRHRYFRLASAEVAQVMEALMAVGAAGPARYRPAGPRDEALRTARNCYDHLAGRLGTALADILAERGHVVLSDGAAGVTEPGRRFFCSFGIDLDDGAGSRRPLCRACLDWSERRPHLAGRIGALLRQRCLDLGWIRPMADSRALAITPAGTSGFDRIFGVTPERLASGAHSLM
jgi:DNA-binding transcriptional ArsR family regulator